MGRAHIIVTRELRDRLVEEDTLAQQVWIMDESDYGEGLVYALVSSAHLPMGHYHGVQALSVEGDRVKFRPDVDV